jgi:prevent-host-death family protein
MTPCAKKYGEFRMYLPFDEATAVSTDTRPLVNPSFSRICQKERFSLLIVVAGRNLMTISLTRSEFEERLGDALDKALSGPVIVTKHGRPKNVVLSYEEYQRLVARDRRVVTLDDWTKAEIAALEAIQMEPGPERFNAELEPPSSR